ncbi:hypothetical protein B0H10DRAFT_105571 [Mycena sp. CBHHK59/15]|nr:hypothetical protein B0H10DRAFT_105571 [Mycena sp. CBHHK59/15]
MLSIPSPMHPRICMDPPTPCCCTSYVHSASLSVVCLLLLYHPACRDTIHLRATAIHAFPPRDIPPLRHLHSLTRRLRSLHTVFLAHARPAYCTPSCFCAPAAAVFLLHTSYRTLRYELRVANGIGMSLARYRVVWRDEKSDSFGVMEKIRTKGIIIQRSGKQETDSRNSGSTHFVYTWGHSIQDSFQCQVMQCTAREHERGERYKIQTGRIQA